MKENNSFESVDSNDKDDIKNKNVEKNNDSINSLNSYDDKKNVNNIIKRKSTIIDENKNKIKKSIIFSNTNRNIENSDNILNVSNLSIFLYIYPHSYSSLIFIHIFGSRLTYLSQSNHVISYRLSPLPYLPCFTSRIRTVYWKCNNTMIVTEHRKGKKNETILKLYILRHIFTSCCTVVDI